MSKLYTNIKKKLLDKSIKDTILTLTANASSQVLGLFVTILVSKSLSVFNYGLYSIINSVTGFISDLADLGMNSSLTRFISECHANSDEKKESSIINYTIKKKTISLLFVLVSLTIFSKPIAKYVFHDESLYYFVFFIFISCAFSLIVGAMRAILQGRREFNKYFIVIIAWNLVWSIIIFLFYCFDRLTIFSSLLASVISGAVNLFLCIHLTKISPVKIFKRHNLDTELKRQFNKFGNWMVLWSIFALFQSKADVLLLATLTTPEQVSYYEIANKVVKPILMIIASYSQVLNPQFAAMNLNQLNQKIKEIIKFIFCISILIVAGIFLVDPILKLIFGLKYTNSIFPAQLLLIAIIFYVWTVPFNSALYALNKPHVFTIASFAGLIITVIGDIILLPSYGAIGAALTYILAQVIGLVVAVIAFKRTEIKETI